MNTVTVRLKVRTHFFFNRKKSCVYTRYACWRWFYHFLWVLLVYLAPKKARTDHLGAELGAFEVESLGV